MTLATDIRKRAIALIEQLPPEQLTEAVRLLESLSDRKSVRNWDNISDREAAALKEEFATEDFEFVEAILPDFHASLKREDETE